MNQNQSLILSSGFLFLGGVGMAIVSEMGGSEIFLLLSIALLIIGGIPLLFCWWRSISRFLPKDPPEGTAYPAPPPPPQPAQSAQPTQTVQITQPAPAEQSAQSVQTVQAAAEPAQPTPAEQPAAPAGAPEPEQEEDSDANP